MTVAQVSAERILVRLVDRVRRLERTARCGVNNMDYLTDPTVGACEYYELLEVTRRAEQILRPEAKRQLREVTDLKRMAEGLTVLAAVCAEYGVTPLDISERSRDELCAAAREDLVSRLDAKGWGPAAIGRFIDRHYSSVIYLLHKRNGASGKEIE